MLFITCLVTLVYYSVWSLLQLIIQRRNESHQKRKRGIAMAFIIIINSSFLYSYLLFSDGAKSEILGTSGQSQKTKIWLADSREICYLELVSGDFLYHGDIAMDIPQTTLMIWRSFFFL